MGRWVGAFSDGGSPLQQVQCKRPCYPAADLTTHSSWRAPPLPAAWRWPPATHPWVAQRLAPPVLANSLCPAGSELAPTDEALLTQQGGCLGFDGRDVIFRHSDSGILKYAGAGAGCRLRRLRHGAAAPCLARLPCLASHSPMPGGANSCSAAAADFPLPAALCLIKQKVSLLALLCADVDKLVGAMLPAGQLAAGAPPSQVLRPLL